ncbi:MAG: ABC transporter transmembrane domain-containing protein [Pseudomonadota bacterium]
MAEREEDRAKARSLGPIRGLFPFLRPYRVLIVAAAIALVFTSALTLILPIAVRRVVDGFLAEDLSQLDAYFGAAIGIAFLLAIGTALRYAIVTIIGERVVADVRRAVYDKVIGMSPAFYETLRTGEVLSRLTTDTTLILSVVSSSISFALRNMLTFAGGLALMLWTSPKMTGLTLLLVPLIIVPILLLGRRLRALSRENQDKIADSSGQASETLLAAQTVQAYTHEAASRAQFGGLTEAAYRSSKARIKVRALMTAIVIFLIFSGVVGVVWIGARDVTAGTLTPGTLVQFLIYAILVAGSVAAFSEIWGEVMRAAGATERLVELLNAEDTVEDPAQPGALPSLHGAITFKGVSFNYPARPDVPTLTSVSLSVQPGETVAIVGPSGSGKSTLFQLLLRFYDPPTGQITLDGSDISELAREELRTAFALVPQEPVIFAASAAENIRFGRPGARDEEVYAAAKAAAAHDFIEKLPEGYDTFVGERGVMLSGGQKQRIAIARAILRDAPVLLLDEATSALDAESEQAVQDAFERLSKERTTLVIAHRLATVKKADRIIVMQDGAIVASGTHDSLVAEGGLYARLARLQFTANEAA